MTSPAVPAPPQSATGRAPLRVLHVLDTFEVGGAQRVVAQLGAWTSERGCEVTLLGRDGAMRHRVDRRLRTELTTTRGTVAELVQLFRLVRRTRPHVLHAHQRREALLCAVVGRALGVPVVEHAHTLLPDRGLRSLSFRSARVFAVSDRVRRMVTDEFGRPSSRVVVVGNTAADRSTAPVRRTHPGDDTALRIVGIGRVTEQKDPLRFVRVVDTVARTRPVRAVWHGEGPLLDRARRLAEELGAPVEFAGSTDTVTRVLDDAHVLLLTSAWEGTPLVALEAFGRECPVVATAACGAPGLLGDGRAVVVDDDASDDEFAAALLTGLRAEEAVTAQTRTARRYLDEQASPEAVFGPVLLAYQALSA